MVEEGDNGEPGGWVGILVLSTLMASPQAINRSQADIPIHHTFQRVFTSLKTLVAACFDITYCRKIRHPIKDKP